MGQSSLKDLANVLTAYALDVRPGEVVLVSGATVSEPLLTALFERLLQSGGLPVLRLTPEVCRDTVLNTHGEDGIRYLNPLGLDDGRKVDCSIGIWCRQEVAPGADDDRAAADSAPGHREQAVPVAHPSPDASGPRWVGTVYPTEASARLAGMRLDRHREFVRRAGLLHMPDPIGAWRQVSARQQQVCDRLERGREIRFLNSSGTDLTLGIQGCRWINGDGHFNFPDGEVCTTPIEDAANGTLVGSFPVMFEGAEIEGIRLQFRDGRIVDASAVKGESVLLRILDADDGARTPGEVALGTNYHVGRSTKCSLLDEKMGGTFHVAVGTGLLPTGSGDPSALHWDIVCDLRRHGRVELDGRLIAADGRFLDPGWPSP